MKSLSDGIRTDGSFCLRARTGPALVSALALLVVQVFAGCTSDDPNVVGTALVTDQIDTVLVALGSEEVTNYSALRVVNPKIPVHRQQVIYMGEQSGTRSAALLANFDFDFEFTDDYPESLFTPENIKTVKFSLTKLSYYSAVEDSITGMPVDLYYQVQTMTAPFDSTSYIEYPGELPTATGPFLNRDADTANASSEPLLSFYDSVEFLNWIAGKEKVGIMVTFGARSDSGLIGFASRELTKYSQLDPLRVGTIAAPNFVVEFQDNTIPNFLLAPYADTSTFDQVPDPPADVDSGFLMRTGLRSYPALRFDLSGLPPNAFINRALLSVTNDTTLSFGTLGSIAVMEWDVERFGDPYRTMPLDDLYDPYEYYSFYVTGQNSVDPGLQGTIQFDVTQSILRIINEVYRGTRGFILTGAEDFLPESAFTSVNPDFYYREFRFMGSAAADQTQRPQLKITYSVVNDLEGKGN